MRVYGSINTMSLLPPPIDLSRQTGISTTGSPIVLSRSSSTGSTRSDVRSIDESLCLRLEAYQTYLQHESDFVASEIQALIDRVPGSDRIQEQNFLHLRDRLKVRFNDLQLKKDRVLALLEVL
jgi:hypothetical protein